MNQFSIVAPTHTPFARGHGFSQHSGTTIHTKAGNLPVIVHDKTHGRIQGAHLTINRVNYIVHANFYQTDANEFELTYLNGDREPWRSSADFGLSPSAKKLLEACLPTLIAIVWPDLGYERVGAEEKKRELDLRNLQGQRDRKREEIGLIEEEIVKLRAGESYLTYPITD